MCQESSTTTATKTFSQRVYWIMMEITRKCVSQFTDDRIHGTFPPPHQREKNFSMFEFFTQTRAQLAKLSHCVALVGWLCDFPILPTLFNYVDIKMLFIVGLRSSSFASLSAIVLPLNHPVFSFTFHRLQRAFRKMMVEGIDEDALW